MAKLILALDKPGKEFTQEQIEDLITSGLDGIKITAAGLFNRIYEKIQLFLITKHYPRNFNVFMDLKVADISFGDNHGTNYKIIKSVSESAVCPITHVSIHGFMGRPAIAEAVEAGGNRLKILVLCAMTDPVYRTRFSYLDTQHMCQWSAEESAFGVILPANDLKCIEHLKYSEEQYAQRPLPVWSPGFGRQNDYGDIYKQLSSWRGLVGDSPDNVAIVGTHLLEHPNLREELQKIKEIIK
jgi:orotidine-5'-phosphate decarboxylase